MCTVCLTGWLRKLVHGAKINHMTQQPESGVVPEFTIGDRLRKAREYAGYEQGPFADLMGVSRGTISNYERDLASKVKPIVLNQWALITGVRRDWLETGEGGATTPPDGGGPTGDGGDELAAMAERSQSRARHTRRTRPTSR